MSFDITLDSPSIIPIWLRNTYATIQPKAISNFHAPLTESYYTEEEAYKILQNETGFVSSDNIVSYLNNKIKRGDNICNHVITIVIISLRDLFWNDRGKLTKEENKQLEIAMRQPLPKFKNVFNYKTLEPLLNNYPFPIYQMFGIITPYSVIHIPVSYFIQAINNKLPIDIELSGTNTIIRLDYKDYDFWDESLNSIVDKIPQRC